MTRILPLVFVCCLLVAPTAVANAVRVESVHCPPTLTAGDEPAATVTLTAPAPSAGAVVSLHSSNAHSARVPATVVVRAGSRTATFALRPGPDGGPVRISANVAGQTAAASCDVTIAPDDAGTMSTLFQWLMMIAVGGLAWLGVFATHR